jgi:hypothetical protein
MATLSRGVAGEARAYLVKRHVRYDDFKIGQVAGLYNTLKQ